MAEGSGLQNRQERKLFESSNLSLRAKKKVEDGYKGQCPVCLRKEIPNLGNASQGDHTEKGNTLAIFLNEVKNRNNECEL